MRQVTNDYKAGKGFCFGTISDIGEEVSNFAPDYGRPGVDESVVALGDLVKHLNFK